MARIPTLCWRVTLAGFDIKLEQAGRDRFIVTYGKQVQKGDYEITARRLGSAIMHALACLNKLDNRQVGEK